MRAWIVLAVIAGLLPVTALGAAPGQPSGVDQVKAAKERHGDRLMAIPGVVGAAVGLTQAGDPAVLVLAERPAPAGIPAAVDGVPVRVVVTGAIEAAHHRPGHSGGPGGGSGDDPGGGDSEPSRTTDRWPRPVAIGTSTGNINSCSAGTLGARVTDGRRVFALSNNHVYALENNAPLGSEVLQPGRYDTNCSVNPDDVLGTLASYVPIVFSTSASNSVDAAIALSDTDRLGKATPSAGYGTPRSEIVAPQLNQAVQKYGRTTELTRGSIVGINATINVGFSSSTARFIDQIVVLADRGRFLRAGDSGSLLVTDPGRNPVGLLFAASVTGYAFANPIDAVLEQLEVAVDGE